MSTNVSVMLLQELAEYVYGLEHVRPLIGVDAQGIKVLMVGSLPTIGANTHIEKAFTWEDLADMWNPRETLLQELQEMHRSVMKKLRSKCEHTWETDTPCDLVDTCSVCGEGRA